MILVCLTGLCVYPQESAAAAGEALRICGVTVIPALFPFFVLTRLLTAFLGHVQTPKFLQNFMARFFGVDGICLSALLLSFLGGYPVGVSCVVSLYEGGLITKKDANRSLLFCNNSGPAFFVAVLGSAVLEDVRLGLILFLIHILAALLVGRLFCTDALHAVKTKELPKEELPASGLFLDAISSSCTALLQISGLIVFFSVILSLLESAGLFTFIEKFALLGLTGEEYCALISGTLELTGGILQVRDSPNAAVLAAFIMGWGGLCVHFQAMSLWHKASLHPRGYFLSKLLHGLISAVLAYCFLQNSPTHYVFAFAIMLLLLSLPKFLRKWGRKKAPHAV